MGNADLGVCQSAADHVWAEVSGIPERDRGRELLMVLQAFIDDSGNRPEHGFFVLAGFISTADRWASFATKWDELLNEHPKLEEFKWTEASRLRGQFDKRYGWTEEKRDKRVRALVRTIKDHALLRVHSGISHEDFARYVKIHPVPRELLPAMESPYAHVAVRVISAAAVLIRAVGLKGACEFYFDRQDGMDKHIKGRWDVVLDAVNRHAKGGFADTIAPDPTFRDSRDFRPLQAADLFAGCIRQSVFAGASRTLRSLARDIPGDGLIMNHDRSIDAAVSMIRAQRRFAQQNPHKPLVPYSGSGARKKGG